MKKVAFITGASRGIGKAIGQELSRNGWNVALTARTVRAKSGQPGTVYSAADEMAEYGNKTLPIPCDITNAQHLEAAIKKTVATFGRLDAIIHNAGAIWIGALEETPLDRFDQVINTNLRAAFVAARTALPVMRKQGSGHIIMIAPPLALENLPNKIPYLISKYGMSMMVSGLAEELKDTNVAVTALWPKTVIESQATINFRWGDPSVWRTPKILADATREILNRPLSTNGKNLIDETFLKNIGQNNFEEYLCRTNGKPQLMPF